MKQRNAVSNAIQVSAIQFRELNDRAKDYVDKEVRNASLGDISLYAKECIDASLNPALLHSGSTTRLSSSSRLAHLNSIRQAEVISKKILVKVIIAMIVVVIIFSFSFKYYSLSYMFNFYYIQYVCLLNFKINNCQQ
jgi:hypothetical protein